MTGTDVRHEPAAQNEAVNAAEVVRSEDLNDLSMAQLRRLWRERVGKKDPPRIRSLLMRELAWHEQQAVHGGFSGSFPPTLSGRISLIFSDRL